MIHDVFEALHLDDELFWEPVRLVPPHPWVGHIPFAFWLIKALRPDVTVELGVHSGNSYFAFCQALAAVGAGRAFAVDTWQGDEHASFYTEEVYADVAAFNTARYASLSTLIRARFDDARAYFADGSVDLLHIDGLHTYEAVKHDFETWRSALSNRGVVLFHDTNVREREFGVWRLWEELSRQHPAFEFHHSYGLGVLGVGADLPPALHALFDAARDPDRAGSVRKLFAARGETFSCRIRAQDEIAARTAAADEALATRTAAMERAAAERAALERRVEEQRQSQETLQDELSYTRQLMTALERVVATKDHLAEVLSAEIRARDAVLRAREPTPRPHDEAAHQREEAIRAKDALISVLNADLADREAALASARETLETLRAEAGSAHAALRDLDATFRNSTSWRVTAPLRLLARKLRPQHAQPAPVAEPVAPDPAPVEASAPPAANDETRASPPDHRALHRALLTSRLDTLLSGTGRIPLPQAGRQPDISILLVLHNQAGLTLGCLDSIVTEALASDLGVEVLVLDNASSDRTGDLLDRVDGLAHVVRSPWNMHFLQGVNELAKHARGRHLLLLNNDAQLLPGSLKAAATVLDEEPDAGAVGGRIILPDGTLQEAGSIIWADGTCSGYARGRDPTDPDVMFRRDVDYCSGAFLMTPRETFERLGGFDPRYAPAYYEETDYCVRVWRDGLRVVYEPDAAILHLEFGSSSGGREDAIALQRRNLDTFRQRHEEWLRAQHPPGAADAGLAASRRHRPGARRILMIEDRVPKPELGSGYPRAHRIVHALTAAGAEVTLYPTFRHPETWPEVRRVLGPTVQAMIRSGVEDLRPFLESRRGAFDGVLICRPHNMQALLNAVGDDRDRLLGGARLVYDAEAVFAKRALLEAELKGEPVPGDSASDLVASETALTHAAAEVISVSAGEADVFLRHGAASVRILGHAFEVKPTPAPFDRRDGFMFLGSVHDDNSPNADSLRWFASEVLPILRSRLGRPDLRLRTVGLVRAPSVLALDGQALDLAGVVADLSTEFNAARVAVLPTRFAAGIPAKAHETAAYGVPMVATELLRDQLGWEDGRELLAASNAVEFAEACLRLHETGPLWDTVRNAALARVGAECSPDRFQRTIREMVEAMPARGAAPVPLRVPPRGFVGRPEAEDASAAVPFAYPPAVLEPPPVAVVCHLFHAELGEEVLSYLRNMPFRADVFISTDTDEKRELLARVFAAWDRGGVEVKVMPNRGRDIAPKLVGFRDVHLRYERVLHLHSKRSQHASFLAPWRTYLYRTLLGSPAVIRSVFEAFHRAPTLGMVAPQHFEPVRRWLDWSDNFDVSRDLAARMGIELDPAAALDFPSGSMFWARTAALRPLLDLDLTLEDFPPEANQVDGTTAHAVERLYFHICERAGFAWMKIADPSLLLDTRAVIRIHSPAELERFVARHQGVLTSKRLAIRGEAPPLKVHVAPALLHTHAGENDTHRTLAA